MIDFRTDLADERAEIVKKNISKDIDGIITTQTKCSDKIEVTEVKVLDETASQKIAKKIGTYITINIADVEILNQENLDTAIKVFSNELSKLIKSFNSILVVGLGNENTTADSIGPHAVKDIEVTRHILKYNPELLPNGSKSVSGLVPGVLGTTGIETQEIIKGVVEKIHFDAIIVVDALSTNNISRLLHTIQICDTGITPGSGVNNKRAEISYETMGIPVIAIGVPTVVDITTIVANTIDILSQDFKEFDFLKDSSYEDKYKLVQVVLNPSNFNLAVMPKDIDALVENLQEIISSGINTALKI